jgi:3'-phosphoadenosine 5'-phosphosulfate sulfotransferase (PAPS reductase)/FAD synthetase
MTSPVQSDLFGEEPRQVPGAGPFIDAAALHPKTLFVANHSGGKDSQVLLIELLKRVPKERLLVVHASLGEAEWPGALEHAQKQASDASVPFVVARASKTLFEMVERRFNTRPDVPSWPSAAHRSCTSDLKRGPIARDVRAYVKERGFTRVVNCLGLRAEESPGRAKRAVLTRVERNTTSQLEWLEWLPIHHFTTAQVFETIRAAGQKPHYAYELGNERLSCVFCIMGSKNDLCNGARHHPQLLDRYKALEQQTGYTMHMSRKPLSELVTPATEPAEPAEAAPARRVRP